MKLFFAFCFLLTSFPLLSQAIVDINANNTIGSYFIPGLVVNKKEGLFVKLHNEIMNRSQLPLELVIEPTQRVQQSFKNNQLIGYFPELWQQIPKAKSEIIVSDSIWLKSIIIFTRKGSQAITQLSDLEGLTIGAVRGYSYGQAESNKNIKIQYVNNEMQNIKKLLSGRIDAIIGDNASTVSAIQNSNEEQNISFNLHQPIDILEVFYIFQNTTQGHKVRNKINNAIQSLKQEGVIKLDLKTGQSQILLP